MKELEEEAQNIRAKLPKKDREVLEEEHEALLNTARRGAGVAIMVRNFSHGKGANVKPK